MSLRGGYLLLVISLVVLGGCSGFAGDGGGDSTVATPAPVPTQQPSVAPGVTADGVDSPSRLVAANGQILNRTSYRLERTVRVAGRGGTLRIKRHQRGTGDGVVLSHLSTKSGGPVETAVRSRTRYRGPEGVYSRSNLSNGRTITERLPPSSATSYFVGQTLPTQLLPAGTYEVDRLSDGSVVLRSADPFDLDRTVTEIQTDPPRNVSARVVVTDRGLVRNVTVEYVTTLGPNPVRVRINQTVSPLDTGTVERPEWVLRAD